MAVSFVGAGSEVYSADALSVPWPGTQSAGDVGLLLLETNETDTVSVSAGTELASSPQYRVAQAHRFSVFYLVAAGSDANVSIPDPGNHGIAQILVFSGVDTTAPINATVGASPGVPSTAVTCAGVTTTVDGCGIVHIVGTGRDGNSTAQFDSWANANLASITEIADVTTGIAAGGGFGAAWGIKTTAGATGDCTVTQAVSAIYTTITVALAPAGGSSPQTVSVTQSVETDTAQSITVAFGARVVLVAHAAETDSAQSITAINPGGAAIAPAYEGDAAQVISPALGALILALWHAAESSSAQAITSSNGLSITIGTAYETAVVQAITPVPGGIIVTLSHATESDVAQGITVFVPGDLTLTPDDLLAIADAVWGHANAIAAHAALDDILARVTC